MITSGTFARSGELWVADELVPPNSAPGDIIMFGGAQIRLVEYVLGPHAWIYNLT